MYEKIDLEIDDFINYCDYKNLSTKTIGSYEQTLRLFIRYLQDNIIIFLCHHLQSLTNHQNYNLRLLQNRSKYL